MASPDIVSLDGDLIRPHVLLRSVAVAAGRASPEIFYEGDESDTLDTQAAAPTVAEARDQGRLILVAEDDVINQKVILQQLGLLGYAGEMADNGAEALRLWRKSGGNYALLLTDLHMPEMDGYALTESIRREEKGAARIPIVALTANALRGEAGRARAIGMDDYLTKPVQLDLLKETLERWLPATADTPSDAGSSRPAAADEPETATPAVDLEVLKGLVGNDENILTEFLTDYLTAAGEQVEELRKAITADDALHVAAIAHKLKSSSRSVGALAFGDRCADLESACKAGDKPAIKQAILGFENAYAVASKQIKQHID
jgi:CheY-like chemotaxis protein/HPt (histidine-containing phosphotransfer) domain-containing protein